MTRRPVPGPFGNDDGFKIYAEMADTTDSVELTDCDSDGLSELFRYMYSDEVNLTGSNVMQVMYLAKKYMVSSLSAKCVEFLLDKCEKRFFCLAPRTKVRREKAAEPLLEGY